MVINVSYTDTCANLVELEFEGVYNGVPRHEHDLDVVVKRARKYGVKRMIVPGSTLRMSKSVLRIVKDQERLFATVAVHPNRINSYRDSVGPDKYRDKLVNMCTRSAKVLAIGRTGLDFSIKELDAAPKQIQIAYLKMHLEVCKELNLPIFLRCNKAIDEMLEVLEKYEGTIRGVVHTFEGSVYDAEAFDKLGLYIGITGCSLKTDRHVEMVKSLPLKRLILGTNCPNCRIKKSFFGFNDIKTMVPAVKKTEWTEDAMVKGRNEPVMIRQVVEAVAGLRGFKPELMAVLNEANTNELFFSARPSIPPPDDSSLKTIDQPKQFYLDTNN